MVLEEQRSLHEDLERLEQGISERVLDKPKHIRDRLNRDHQVAAFLNRIHDQSKRLLSIYNDSTETTTAEIQSISLGDQFEEFYKQLGGIKDFHKRYPNEPLENLERAYRRRGQRESEAINEEVDAMFSGEEALGRFLDLVSNHEEYLNLKGGRIKPLNYIQYLELFDNFGPPHIIMGPQQKSSNEGLLKYYTSLIQYLEGFIRRTRPLEDVDKLLDKVGDDFTTAWDRGEVPGWEKQDTTSSHSLATNGTSHDISQDPLYCKYCGKSFTNNNVYKAHLTGKKHLKAVKDSSSAAPQTNGTSSHDLPLDLKSLRAKIIASKEHRIAALATLLSQTRKETRANAERKQGMTERERAQEIAALMAESSAPPRAADVEASKDDGSDSEGSGEERVYNPLKLPLAWDGKPIPYWLYKLHGLGVEFTCEICGNFVYMGRRAFDKHFNEPRHVYGLKCLGITTTPSVGPGQANATSSAAMAGQNVASLFREITGIDEAVKLWEKVVKERKRAKVAAENVVQMEDGEGNVMPERVYWDLQKQGLL